MLIVAGVVEGLESSWPSFTTQGHRIFALFSGQPVDFFLFDMYINHSYLRASYQKKKWSTLTRTFFLSDHLFFGEIHEF